MKKREFLKLTSIAGAGMLISPFISCNSANPEQPEVSETSLESNPLIFELPTLGFAYNALQPYIDAMTMEIHHSKHHAGYVKKLNLALEGTHDFNDLSIEGILAKVTEDQTGVRNNGGGHYNHSMYWRTLLPGGSDQPTGQLADAINASFESVDLFNEKFFAAAKTRFGSGWAWLSVDENKKLFISSTPNQDNPLMKNIVSETGTPILGIDVWEHAYYLNYQNKRGDYINAFMSLLNWDVVAENFAKLM